MDTPLTPEKPRIGVSSCLLGNAVRFNGEHKRHDWMVDRLGRWVTWVPFCPEVAMGLGVPRESVSLVRTEKGSSVRMVSHKARKDLTELAETTAQKLLSVDPGLDGFILKKDSPSCGMDRVKIYEPNGMPARQGQGFFAAELMRRFPDLPVTEEGRLFNPELREQFVTAAFAYQRLKRTPADIAELQKFHQHYKLVLMAHSPVHYQNLGKLAANSERRKPELVLQDYRAGFMEALKVPSTRNKRVNVLQHLAGYLKRELDRAERHEIIDSIEEYQRGEIPIIVPLSLIRHHVRKLALPYISEQLFFQPYPRELGLQSAI